MVAILFVMRKAKAIRVKFLKIKTSARLTLQ